MPGDIGETPGQLWHHVIVDALTGGTTNEVGPDRVVVLSVAARQVSAVAEASQGLTSALCFMRCLEGDFLVTGRALLNHDFDIVVPARPAAGQA